MLTVRTSYESATPAADMRAIGRVKRLRMPRCTAALSRELAAMVIALSSLLILLASVQFQALRSSAIDDLGATAELLARNLSAALIFDSLDDAQAVLDALMQSSTISTAELYALDGRLIASRTVQSPEWGHGLVLLQVSRDVYASGAVVGYLTLQASSSRIAIWTGVFLAVGAVAVAAAWLASCVSARRASMAALMAQQSLSWMSRHDPLTGCANREELRAQLQACLQRPQASPALFLIDIDDFGLINAAYGTQQGDAVLRVIAQRLQVLAGSSDCLARISADEFALLMNEGQEERLHGIAMRIQALASEPILIGNAIVRVSACIGMALLPGDGTTVASALGAASAGLAAARVTGHGRIARYKQAQERLLRERARLTDALRQALKRSELSLYYQPIHDIRTGHLRYAEALVRWNSPEHGPIPPDTFVPLAETAGFAEDMGLHILGRLHRDRSDWLEAGVVPPPVAVNLSAMQFVREGAKAAFLDRLETLGLTPDAMQVELTERAAFEEVDAADSILNSLREQGYELALDDFGTGYSSLSYLHRIRCSKIKIDRSFVRDMDRNEGARKLVKAIVDVAHAFGIRTVAEGVETERELDVLRSLGCDFAQGYLLGRPMAAAAFLQLISAEQARQSADSQT